VQEGEIRLGERLRINVPSYKIILEPENSHAPLVSRSSLS